MPYHTKAICLEAIAAENVGALALINRRRHDSPEKLYSHEDYLDIVMAALNKYRKRRELAEVFANIDYSFLPENTTEESLHRALCQKTEAFPPFHVDTGGLTRSSTISPEWIQSLVKKINDSYPAAIFSWQSPKYPEEHIELVSYNLKRNDKLYNTYNPFNLRLPYALQSCENLYNHTRINRNPLHYHIIDGISKTDASTTYLNFLKQYNLAYITFFQAINGSEQAITKLRELFTTKKMFTDAMVTKLSYLSERAKNPTFFYTLLGYLTLDIVYSKESNITTAARIKALELLNNHFDVEKIAAAFGKSDLGYVLPDSIQDEPVHDMIPRKFVSSPNEAGGMPHNQLFIVNTKIKEIFQIKNIQFGKTINLDYGISTLLNKFPSEMLQVLQSLLRCNSYVPYIDRALIFTAIVNLSKLDNVLKGRIFGMKASFRNNGNSPNGVEARVGWILGGESFGDYLSEDELNGLSFDELKMRLRQAAYRMQQLEQELVEKERSRISRVVTVENDPKGYFTVLLLHPDTPEESFDELLNRHYRVLALKLHPDKPTGNLSQFLKLQEAFEFLRNPSNREEYRAAANNRTFGMASS